MKVNSSTEKHLHIFLVCVYLLMCVMSDCNLECLLLSSALFGIGLFVCYAHTRRTGPRAPGDSSVSVSSLAVEALGLQRQASVPTFMWILGIRTQVLTLAWQHFIHRVISPASFLSASVPTTMGRVICITNTPENVLRTKVEQWMLEQLSWEWDRIMVLLHPYLGGAEARRHIYFNSYLKEQVLWLGRGQNLGSQQGTEKSVPLLTWGL